MNRPELLVLVRHGESTRNVAKKHNVYFLDDESRKEVAGVPDHETPLTELGHAQAKATGEGLRRDFGTIGFDYIYNSGYRRTVETTQDILAAYPEHQRSLMRVRQNLFIRERDSGHAFDMTTEEVDQAFPWLAGYWKTAGGFFAHPPGGESLAQVCERVYLFLGKLFRERCNQKICVVTHGGTLRAFRFLLEHWTYEDAVQKFRKDPPRNCSVTVYRGQQDRMVLEEYNRLYY